MPPQGYLNHWEWRYCYEGEGEWMQHKTCKFNAPTTPPHTNSFFIVNDERTDTPTPTPSIEEPTETPEAEQLDTDAKTFEEGETDSRSERESTAPESVINIISDIEDSRDDVELIDTNELIDSIIISFTRSIIPSSNNNIIIYIAVGITLFVALAIVSLVLLRKVCRKREGSISMTIDDSNEEVIYNMPELIIENQIN
jgi:hypothetical protein